MLYNSWEARTNNRMRYTTFFVCFEMTHLHGADWIPGMHSRSSFESASESSEMVRGPTMQKNRNYGRACEEHFGYSTLERGVNSVTAQRRAWHRDIAGVSGDRRMDNVKEEKWHTIFKN